MSNVVPIAPPPKETGDTNSPVIIVFGVGAFCGAIIGFILASVLMVALRIGCR